MDSIRLRVLPACCVLALLFAPPSGCGVQRVPLPSSGGGAGGQGEFGPGQGGGGGAIQNGREMLGLFLGELSGTITGNTLIEVRGTGDRFQITTITGAGFVTSISSDGLISVLGMTGDPGEALGGGTVIGNNSFTLDAVIGGSFTFPDGELSIVADRVPGTDASFPLNITPLASGSLINAVYVGTTVFENPAGGGFSNTLFDQRIFVNSVTDSTTVQLPSLDAYTGVAYVPVRAAVRVVSGGSDGYATLAGSGTNTGRDVIGRIDFVSPLGIESTDFLSATIVTQTRAPLGSQTQQTIRISATGT